MPNVATHLDAWYLGIADRVRYFGVNAGNERFQPEPCLFDSEQFITGGVLLQLLPRHPGACIEHGYQMPDRKITATAAKGNAIVQIDWRPALDVYRELMQAQYGVAITRDNFYEHAVHFPFGILRADGEVLVRIPVALGERGEIVCAGEIPPNSLVMLLDGQGIIEDNEQNRYLLTFLLEKSGYQVAVAINGAEGIERAARLEPAIILLDIQLPTMDGYQVARALRENERLVNTPIIAVTSYAMPGDREKALGAGCTGYIEKPINPDTFVAEMERLVTR